jgi:hypothetical protein
MIPRRCLEILGIAVKGYGPGCELRLRRWFEL